MSNQKDRDPGFFDSIISRMVASLTWLTLPGAEVNSAVNMVCMESITTTSGFIVSNMPTIESTATSETTSRPGDTVLNR